LKTKILTALLLIIAIVVSLSLGYDTILKSQSGIEIRNLSVRVYIRSGISQSYVGDPKLSAIKGFLLSWYSGNPNSVVTLNPGFESSTDWTGGGSGGDTRVSSRSSTYKYSGSYSWRLYTKDTSNNLETAYVEQTFSSSDIHITRLVFYYYPKDITHPNLEAIDIYDSSGNQVYFLRGYGGTHVGYGWYKVNKSLDVYGNRIRITIKSHGDSIYNDPIADYYFDEVYLYSTSPALSSFQVSFDYSISSNYTVAYKTDLGKNLNTFNYTINIYHNVDSNQTWVLAYSEYYYNATEISLNSYASPWLSLLNGSYSTGWHTYYYKIEIIVDAYDSLTGQSMSKSSYVILSDQFYWQNYMEFNSIIKIVDTNMMIQSIIQPPAIILAMTIVATYLIIRRRMLEKD
jgi:hypothetical protein